MWATLVQVIVNNIIKVFRSFQALAPVLDTLSLDVMLE